MALTVLGFDKFHYVLAGGKKFATFPNWQSQWAIGFSYLVVTLLYLVWFFYADKQPLPRFFNLLQRAAVFLLLAFIAYPLGDDIYLYLHSGLMNLSAVNPFLTRAKVFTTELSPFVDWGQTSTYGPLSQLLFTTVATLVPVHPFVAIYAYKSVCLGLHILNGYLIWRLLPSAERGITERGIAERGITEQGIAERSTIALAYLLHPLLLMEQVGSGHVDLLVSTSAIVAIGSLTVQRYVSTFVALWGGLLAKTLPLLWMPLVGIFLLRQKRWWQLAGAIALSLALIVALWLTHLPNLYAWQSLLNPGVVGQYQSSLPALLKAWLNVFRILALTTLTLPQINDVLLWVSHYALIGFLSFYSWLALRGYTRQHYTELNLIEAIGWTTLTLLLFATPWLMPWYASVLLAIAALIPQSQRFGLTVLAFAFSSSAQYLLQGHTSLKSIVAIGLPTFILLAGPSLLQRRSLPASEPATIQS